MFYLISTPLIIIIYDLSQKTPDFMLLPCKGERKGREESLSQVTAEPSHCFTTLVSITNDPSLPRLSPTNTQSKPVAI